MVFHVSSNFTHIKPVNSQCILFDFGKRFWCKFRDTLLCFCGLNFCSFSIRSSVQPPCSKSQLQYVFHYIICLMKYSVKIIWTRILETKIALLSLLYRAIQIILVSWMRVIISIQGTFHNTSWTFFGTCLFYVSTSRQIHLERNAF